jgi:GT2 family glycosyltransferase
MGDTQQPAVSLIVVSFNTRDLLRACLDTVQRTARDVPSEIIVVDNASADGSADMVVREFPQVRLIRSPVNLGFGAANNRGFECARGRYVVLLNTDALLTPGALAQSVARMEADPTIALAGARLVGPDGAWQPSGRLFTSLTNDLLLLSGLAQRYARSRFFGRYDRTWADPRQPAEVDWVPGAYAIIRREALTRVGQFDEAFFLYYEEVDLCRRLKAAGYRIWYWPDVVVMHVGGASSKTLTRLTLSSSGSQLTLWRMRSQLLYYRKHHGPLAAWASMAAERTWHALRRWKHQWAQGSESRAKAEESRAIGRLMKQAWKDTGAGRWSPARPW